MKQSYEVIQFGEGDRSFTVCELPDGSYIAYRTVFSPAALFMHGSREGCIREAEQRASGIVRVESFVEETPELSRTPKSVAIKKPSAELKPRKPRAKKISVSIF